MESLCHLKRIIESRYCRSYLYLSTFYVYLLLADLMSVKREENLFVFEVRTSNLRNLAQQNTKSRALQKTQVGTAKPAVTVSRACMRNCGILPCRTELRLTEEVAKIVYRKRETLEDRFSARTLCNF
jgi:hypothetical protein